MLPEWYEIAVVIGEIIDASKIASYIVILRLFVFQSKKQRVWNTLCNITKGRVVDAIGVVVNRARVMVYFVTDLMQ